MRNRAADRAFVAGLKCPTLGSATATSGSFSAALASQQLVLRHGGADLDPAAHVADRVELRNARDVDQHRRIGEPQIEHRHQRLSAGEHAGIVAVFAKHADASSALSGHT